MTEISKISLKVAKNGLRVESVLKGKVLCQVTFKYKKIVIFIQQFLPINFYNNLTDEKLT